MSAAAQEKLELLLRHNVEGGGSYNRIRAKEPILKVSDLYYVLCPSRSGPLPDLKNNPPNKDSTLFIHPTSQLVSF